MTQEKLPHRKELCLQSETSVDFSTEVYIRRSTPASQGYKDSNLEMTESESVALPFGDSPMSFT